MTPTEARMALEQEQREQDEALSAARALRRAVKHRAVISVQQEQRDKTAPSTIGRHVKVCGDIGPIIP